MSTERKNFAFFLKMFETTWPRFILLNKKTLYFLHEGWELIFQLGGRRGADTKTPSRGTLLFGATCHWRFSRPKKKDLRPLSDIPDSYILINSCSCQSRFEPLGIRNMMSSLLSSNWPEVGREKYHRRNAHTALQIRSQPLEVIPAQCSCLPCPGTNGRIG